MIEAHYTTEVTVPPQKHFVATPPSLIPKQNSFSDSEADKKLKVINNDIYESTQKEKNNSRLNKSLYFKIFGILGLTIAGIAGFDKIKKFFK